MFMLMFLFFLPFTFIFLCDKRFQESLENSLGQKIIFWPLLPSWMEKETKKLHTYIFVITYHNDALYLYNFLAYKTYKYGLPWWHGG